MKALLLALLLALPFEAGTVEIRQFSDPVQEQRYERLAEKYELTTRQICNIVRGKNGRTT